MRRLRGRTLFSGIAILVVLGMLAAPSALAKGPARAVLAGPGVAAPIPLTWSNGTTTGPDLGNVMLQSGLWGGLFGPGRTLLRHQPVGDLGPRYTITYTMTFPGEPASKVVQYVFPYAEPRPITYVPANQAFWDGDETYGGWNAARSRLKETLIGYGLPVSAPVETPVPATGQVSADPTSSSSRSFVVLLSVAAVLTCFMIAVLSRRRRGKASLTA